MQFFSIFLLTISWIGYFLIHSLAASNELKRKINVLFPIAGKYYRLGYNALAVFLLIPPIYILYSYEWGQLWQWSGYYSWLQFLLGLGSILGFLITLRTYGGMEFLGISQALSSSEEKHNETLHISNFHRYVRHPWYFLALVLLWSRDMNLGLLITAIFISLYFIIGSRLEEKKLILEFGERYANYCNKVPGLIPLPWKFLNKEQALALTANSHGDKNTQ